MIYEMEVIAKGILHVEADSKKEALEKAEVDYSLNDVEWSNFVQVKLMQGLQSNESYGTI